MNFRALLTLLAIVVGLSEADAQGSGGTVSTSGAYNIHTFTSSGTFSVSNPVTIEVLVVAGGGAGGDGSPWAGYGGGGGAGGVVYQSSVSLGTGNYAVTIGAGGAGGSQNGGNSSFNGITAIGGGGGGRSNGSGITGFVGRNGGSGGGGASAWPLQAGGSGTSAQGSPGGNGPDWGGVRSPPPGGGGGGASGTGTNVGGGGPGYTSYIQGYATTYASGGGGGIDAEPASPGGGAGAGAGGSNTHQNGRAATPNTGSGGGGANHMGSGGAGGSGIVIIKYVRNAPPTVVFHTRPPSPIYKDSWFPVRATGSDIDGNLGGVWVEYSVNGGSWQALAYDPASGQNGNGNAATTNSNSVLAGPPGTQYVFRCYAWDQAGANSGWHYSGTYTVLDRSGSGSFTIAGVPSNATIAFGQSVTIASSVTDPDGNMTVHSFWWDQGNGTYWTHPFRDWSAAPNRDGWYNLNLGSNGYDASGGSSTRSFDFRPVRPATYAFHNVVADPINWVGVGASVLYLTVNKAAPNINGWGNQSRTGTGAFPSAFGVSLSNPHSTAVAAPTGSPTFAVVSASGSGASPTSGAVGSATNFLPGTYTVRCSYSGDANYNAASWDATFTVLNRPPTASLSVNKTSALINESVTITMTVSDPDGNLDYTNLWVQTPTLGWRWIHADNTVATGSALDRAHSCTPYGASGTFTRTFTFTGAQGDGTYRFALAAVDAQGARTDAPEQPTVSVSKITPVINVSLPESIVYGTPLPAWASTTVPGSFSYSPAVGTVLGAGTNPVSVTFTPSDPSTYNSITRSATLIVTKASLTVKANNATKTYGASNPAFTATYTGFVNGDSAAVVSGAPSFNTDATAASGVGPYPVSPLLGSLSASNYTFATFLPGTLTIAPKEVSFDFTNTSFVYDGSQKAPVIGNPSGATYTVSGTTAATNAGSYSFTVTATENYTGSSTCSWSIARRPVTFTFTNLEFFYDNSPKGPTINNPGAATYDVTGARTATVPGSYSFTVTATGNFIGSATCNWAIGCCPADVFLGNLSHTYDGTAKAATATTQPSGLNVAFTYNGSSAPPTNAGTYTVIASVADSPNPSRADPTAVFIGHAEGTLVIAKADQATLTLHATTTQTHGSTQTLSTSGGSGTGSVTYQIVGQSTGSSVSISGAALSVNSGTGWVDVRASKAGDSNYHPSAPSNTVRVTFQKASQSALTVMASTPQTFNTSQVLSTTGGSGSGVVSYSIVEESEPGAALLSGVNNQTLTAATGTGSVKVRATKAGDTNYNSISSQPATISFAKAPATIAFANLNPVYDGTEKEPTVSTAPAPGLAVHLTFDGNAAKPINAGAYEVVGTINDPDYAGTRTETFAIQKAPATVTLGSLSHTYDGAQKSATATTNPSGLTVNFTYNGSATRPTNAGNYAVVATIEAPNHTGSATGTLVINKANQAALTLTAATPQVMGTPQTLTATGGSGGGALSYSIVAQSSPGAASLAGAVLTPNIGTGWVDVRATRAGSTNYNPANSNTVRVNFAKATASITLNNLSHTYDGTVKTANATTAPSGLLIALTYGTGNRIDVGSYSVTATVAPSDPNYTGSASGTLVINPAPQNVTISTLTPSVTFGQSVTFTATGGHNGYFWAGAASGSGPSVTLTPTAAGAVSVTAYSPAGGNYLRSNDASADAVVTRIIPIGTFPGKTVDGPYTLNSADLQATFAHPNNPLMPLPTGTLTYEPAANTKLNAGTHTITARYPGDNNYAPATVTATFVVNRSTPDITWNPTPLRYGETYGASQRGAVAKVGGQIIEGTFKYTPASGDVATTVGSKEITVHFTPNDSANYNSVVAARTISIGKGSQSIRFENPGNQQYGDLVVLTGTATSGLAVDYTISGAQPVHALSNGAGKALKADRIGTVTVTARQEGNEYYDGAPAVTRQFSVLKASHAIEFPNPADTGYVLLARSTAGIPVQYELSDSTGGWVIRDVFPIDPNLPPFKQLAFTGYLPNKTVRVMAKAGGDFHEDVTVTSPMFSSSGPDSFWITRPADTVVAAQGYHLSFYAHHSISPDDSQILKLFARHNSSSQWTDLGSGYFNAHGVVNTGVFVAQAGTWEIKVVNGPDANSPDYTNHRLTIHAINGQVINFPDPGPREINKAFDLGATTTAPGHAVTYHVIEGQVEFVTASSIKVAKPGKVTIEARQNGSSSYAPARSVRRTFTAMAPPQLVIEEPLSYSTATGILSAKGWALDYEDGAPIAVTVVIDGVSHDLVVVEQRPDIAAQAAAGNWSTGSVLECGWRLHFPVASLAEGAHSVFIRAVDGSELKAEAGLIHFNGGTPVQRAEIITFPDIGPRGFGEQFTLQATSASGRKVTYEVVEGAGLITLAGELVTVGNSAGHVVIRASLPEEAGYTSASIDRLFSIADGDGDGDGVPDWWERAFGIEASPGSDANGDGVKDIDEYHLWRSPKGKGAPEDSVKTILNVTAKGSGNVTLTIGDTPYKFSFLGAGDQWQEPYPFGTNVHTYAEINAKLAEETEVAVSWSGSISDFIIKSEKPRITESELRSRVELSAPGSGTPIQFSDAINKVELTAANGGNKIRVRAMTEGSLPFGVMDTSKLEVHRRLRFGLGGTRTGDSAGMIVYSAQNYVLGGGIMNFAISKGPAMTDVREHISDPKRFQARVPAGYVDVYRLRHLITIRFYPDGTYPDDGPFKNFAGTTPLVAYSLAGGLMAKTGSITQTAGGNTLVLEFENERSVGESRVNGDNGSYTLIRDYAATFKHWGWRKPSAAREGMTSVRAETFQTIRFASGNSPGDVTNQPTFVKIYRHQGPSDTDGILAQEEQQFGAGDTELRYGASAVLRGSAADQQIVSHRYTESPSSLLSPPAIEVNSTGGQTKTEYFTSSRHIGGGSNLGTHPGFVAGERKSVRRGFLDGGPGDANAIVTDYTYKNHLVDGRAVPATAITKQEATTIGDILYDYSTPTTGQVITETKVQPATNVGRLTTILRAYSRRLADLDLRDKPIAITRPEGTKTVYSYRVAGEDLVVAELNGKTGASINTFNGSSLVEGLDMDANRSIAIERTFDKHGRLKREESFVYQGGTTFASLGATEHGYDVLGNLTSKTHSSGRVLYQAGYTGFRKDWESDEQGVRLDYVYDDYNRVYTVTRASASEGANTIAATTTTYEYDQAGRLVKETVSATGTTETLVSSYTYDTANRPKTRTLPGNFKTTITYDSATKTTTTLPGGGTKIEEVHKDGRVKSVTGTAVPDTTTTYAYDSTTGNLKTTQTTAGQWATTETDWAGRTASVSTPTYAGTTRVVSNTYTGALLTKQETKVGSTAIALPRIFKYDDGGYARLIREGLDANGNGVLEPSTDYDVKEYEFAFQTGAPNYSTNLYRYEGVKIWPHDGTSASTSRFASQTYTQVTGLGSTTIAHAISRDFDQNITDSTTTVDRTSKKVTVSTTASGTTATLQQVTLNGLPIRSVNAQGHVTLQTYDALGRVQATDDPRIGTTDHEYHANTTLLKLTTAPDTRTTQYAYDTAGRVKSQTNPDGKMAYFQYDPAGNLTHQWGETVNPVKYVYNELGQKTEMHTYRSGSWTGSALPGGFTSDGDKTTWTYQATTGLLTTKKDAANATTSFEYTDLGQVKKRTDARGWVTNYEYTDARKLLTKVDYTGTAETYTTDVIYTYDRAGRTTSVTDAAGRRKFDYYDDAGAAGTLGASARLKSEYFDTSASAPTAVLGAHTLTHVYKYGEAGVANGSLGELKLNTSTHVAYGYDSVMRLNSVAYAGGTPFTYTYVANSNLVDQVTQGASGYLRDYDYLSDSNRLDKLKHAWGTDTATQVESVVGRDGYNRLGLRTIEKTTGVNYMNALGRGSEAGVHTDYTYTDRMELDDSGKYALLAGGALGGLRGGTARDYDYDAIGNRTADQFGAYTPNALNQYTAAPGFGAFSYDANGNLKADGLRTYDYDAENRLITVTQDGAVWNYKYDYLGRRIEKSGPSGTTRFLYDGWNLIAELDASNTVQRRFAWGLDVSGTLQGAGGVGGLLVIDSGITQYRPVYDASHNVIALYDGSGNTVAAYEYDPFGKHSAQGAYATQNPFRFSTKYTDAETEFVYYGHRYYVPTLGRFLNRDPIEEAGGLNLYGFCGNDGVNRWDYLGMNAFTDWFTGLFGRNEDPKIDPVPENPKPKPTDEEKRRAEEAAEAARRKAAISEYGIAGWMMHGGHGSAAVESAADQAYRSSLANSKSWRSYVAELGAVVLAPNSAWTDQDRTAAKYASDVYGDNTGGLLNKLGIPYDPKNGFAAGLYLGPDGKYYLAMRGTQPTSGANWWANFKQALGFKSPQYEQAVNLARAADRAIGAIGGDLIIVGHSLGGGLASAGSYATGRDAITFNAAGLSNRYATGDPGDIRAHYIQGDILSMAQDYTPFIIPSAAGTRIPHGAAHWYEDPLSRHLMSNFLGL